MCLQAEDRQAVSSYQEPNKPQGSTLPSRPPRECGPANALKFDFILQNVRESFSVVSSPPV